MTARRSIARSLSIESVEQLQRVGAAFFEDPPKKPLFPFSDGNCLARHESSVITRLRQRLAEVLGKPINHQFFGDQYRPGEDANAALLRLFRQSMTSHATDDETIESMVKSR